MITDMAVGCCEWLPWCCCAVITYTNWVIGGFLLAQVGPSWEQNNLAHCPEPCDDKGPTKVLLSPLKSSMAVFELFPIKHISLLLETPRPERDGSNEGDIQNVYCWYASRDRVGKHSSMV